MPRGGGFGGGGFSGGRGGGFGGGGGFRGGGFRGSSRPSFRSYSGRSSGTPFGRTGARRTVTGSRTGSTGYRGNRGPYRHGYYRPHRRYYGWYYGYPWYRRWYYNPWFFGYYNRPWYYSPVYTGGGIILAIVAMLIFLPLMGLTIAYPFSSADSSGFIRYTGTETLAFNEYWYEYENIQGGNQIEFSVDSQPGLISFAISDEPFQSLDTTTASGSDNGAFSLEPNAVEYWFLFFRPGSSVIFNYNTSEAVDFLILDGNNIYDWWYERPYTAEYEVTAAFDNVTSNSNSKTFNSANDYYLVWWNPGVSTVDVEFSIEFEATNVPDLTTADYSEIGVDSIAAGTFDVPEGASGNWYFFIYFDPMLNQDESVEISFNVGYSTGISGSDRWENARPFLIGLGVVLVILMVIAVFSRKSQKQKVLQAQTTQKTAPVTPASPAASAAPVTQTTPHCLGCGSDLRPNVVYCPNCGRKREGRKLGDRGVSTPARSKICSYCGSKLSEKSKFCATCGTRVEQ